MHAGEVLYDASVVLEPVQAQPQSVLGDVAQRFDLPEGRVVETFVKLLATLACEHLTSAVNAWVDALFEARK